MSLTPGARRAVMSLGAGVLLVVAFAWCAHPVCVPLDAETVAEAAKYGALETRADRQLHGRVWQQRDGRWHQCKSWISRQLFF